MKHRLNLFKAFTAVLLLTANIAFAGHGEPTKEEVKKNDGVWSDFLDSIRNSRLTQKINLPSLELFRGIEIGGKYKFTSDPSVAQNYSGIDVWEVKAGVDSRIFGYDLPANIGANVSKQITYIQQFPNRRESLLRIPYDPISKIPRTAQDFYKRDNDGQLVFKTGDFIGYRIPLTFESNSDVVQNLAGSLIPVNIGYRYFISGEFDIQVFRMSEDSIRLKIIAVNDRVRGWFGGVKIFAQDPVTSFVVEKVFDDRVYSGSSNDRKTDLYLGDYVFNLGSADARELYDSILAPKMKILNVSLLKEYLKVTQFVKDRKQFNKNLFADLSQFNAVAAEDKNLPADKRRIIKIINAENHTDADESSHTFNLLRLLKYNRNSNASNAEIAVVGDTADSKEHYYLHAVGKNSKFSILDNWKKEKRTQLNLLFKTDSAGNKTGLIGMHFSKSRQHFSLSHKKYWHYYSTTGRFMPDEIRAKIKFPHEGKKIQNSFDNVFLNYEIYITSKILELNQNLPQNVIEQRVSKLLSTISASDNKVEDDEKEEIIEKLTEMFSTHTTLDRKFEILDNLMTKNDLFEDYGLAIIINAINPETVSQSAIVQLSYSGHGMGTGVSKYPSEEAFTRMNLFRNIIDQNNYILDRSYNLRNFLKEDGKPFSLAELMLKNDVTNKQ